MMFTRGVIIGGAALRASPSSHVLKTTVMPAVSLIPGFAHSSNNNFRSNSAVASFLPLAIIASATLNKSPSFMMQAGMADDEDEELDPVVAARLAALTKDAALVERMETSYVGDEPVKGVTVCGFNGTPSTLWGWSAPALLSPTISDPFIKGVGLHGDELYVKCATCPNPKEIVIRSDGRPPFEHYLQHCEGKKHLRLIAQTRAAPLPLVTTTAVSDAAALQTARSDGVTLVSALYAVTRRSSNSSALPPAPIVQAPSDLLQELFPGQFNCDIPSMTFTCTQCGDVCLGLGHSALENNARCHLRGAKHIRFIQDRMNSGGGIARHGFGPAAAAEISPPPPPVSASVVCNGYWRPDVNYGVSILDASLLMQDFRGGATWYPEPRCTTTITSSNTGTASPIAVLGSAVETSLGSGKVVWGASDRGNMTVLLASSSLAAAPAKSVRVNPRDIVVSTTHTTGTFKSVGCAKICTDNFGQALPFLMCKSCSDIPKEGDFRMRICRANKADGEINPNLRLDRVPTHSALLERAQEAVAEAENWKRRAFFFESKFNASQTRARNMREKLGESVLDGNLLRMVEDLKHCAQNGSTGRETQFKFIGDLIHAIRLPPGCKNMQWTEESKRMFGVMKKYGGPRTLQLLKANVAAPDRRTVERHWAASKHHYSPGLTEENIAHVASVMKPLIEQLQLPSGESVLYETAEDETGILSDLDYCQRRDAVLGGCGVACAEHHCDFQHMTLLGDGTEVGRTIDDECDNQIRASYARLIIINPLNTDLPRLALAFSPTCNRFTKEDVRKEWTALDVLLDKYLKPLGMSRTGHASDGDARRFSLQKEFMTQALPPDLTPFRVNHPGLTLAGAVMSDGTIKNLESQDPIHNAKKFYAPTDNAARCPVLGKYAVSHNHQRQVFAQFPPSAHDMDSNASKREDRQSFVNVVRATGIKTSECLVAMQQARVDCSGTLHPPEQTQGTVAYAGVVREFTRLHFSPTMTPVERVESASYVLNFNRFWRNHVHDTSNTLTLAQNFLSKQTSEHLSMGCQTAILLIKAQGIKSPSLPVDLTRTGSDGCELFFSMLGGYGAISSYKRNFNYRQGLDGVGDIGLLGLWSVGEHALVLKNPNRKQEYEPKYHEQPAEAAASSTHTHPSEADIVAAAERGLCRARDMAVSLEMVVSDVGLMARPWDGDSEGVTMLMRDDDEGDGEDSLVGKYVEITGTKSDLDGKRGFVTGYDSGFYMVRLGDGSVHPLARSNIKLIFEETDEPCGDSAGGDSSAGREQAAVLLLAEFEELIPDEALGDEGAEGGGGGDGTAKEQEKSHACTFVVNRGGAPIAIHKTTYLYEKKQLLKGVRLARDRLVKVATAGLQFVKGLFSADGPSELQLEVQSHFALAVVGPDGTMVWWIGRAIQVLLPVGQRSAKVLTRHPMTLEEAQRRKVKVVGSYFSLDKSDGVLTHLGTPECTDPAQYSAASILSLVELTYVGSQNKYKFRDGDIASKLDGLLAALGSGRSTTALETATRDKANAKRTADQSGVSDEGAGLGAEVAKKGALIPGVSFSGRATTRGAS